MANRGRSQERSCQTSSPVPPLGRRFGRLFISGGGAAPSEGPEVGRAKIAGRFLPEVESGWADRSPEVRQISEVSVRGGVGTMVPSAAHWPLALLMTLLA